MPHEQVPQRQSTGSDSDGGTKIVKRVPGSDDGGNLGSGRLDGGITGITGVDGVDCDGDSIMEDQPRHQGPKPAPGAGAQVRDLAACARPSIQLARATAELCATSLLPGLGAWR